MSRRCNAVMATVQGEGASNSYLPRASFAPRKEDSGKYFLIARRTWDIRVTC